MGCGPSNVAPQKGNGASTVKVPVAPKRPVYDLKVNIGANVSGGEEGKPNTIVLFGGPGTRKGLMLEKLMDEYNFRVLSCETLIQNQLRADHAKAERQRTRIDPDYEATVLDTKALYNSPHAEKVNLAWALQLIRKEIETDTTHAGFVVDLLPNHKYLLRSDTFVADAEKALKEFEQEHFKFNFALNLSIPEALFDKTINAQKQTKMEKKAAEEKGADNKKGAETSDEADTGKTKRRFKQYQKNSGPLLAYFSDAGRTLEVEMTVPHEVAWEEVQKVCQSLMFSQLKHRLHTVVLFAFDGMELNGVNLSSLGLKEINLKQLLDANASKNEVTRRLSTALMKGQAVPVKESLQCVQEFVAGTQDVEGFVVNTEGVPFEKENIAKHSDDKIMFHNYGHRGISHLFTDSSKNDVWKADNLNFQTVSSTKNEYLVFPNSAESELCERIGHCMRLLRA